MTNSQKTINSCVIPNSLEDLGEFLAICPGTLGNLISHLPRNLPEPHQPSAPEPSGTSSAFCPGTLQNLVCYLHRNPPGTSSAICPGTFRNLISNLHQNCRDQMVPGSIPGGRICHVFLTCCATLPRVVAANLWLKALVLAYVWEAAGKITDEALAFPTKVEETLAEEWRRQGDHGDCGEAPGSSGRFCLATCFILFGLLRTVRRILHVLTQ